MDDLVVFYAARLDEDEQAAREATPGPWRVDSEPLFSGLHRVVTTDYHEDLATGNETGDVVVAGDDVGGTDLKDAEHIARHDPARVLREVKAKRRIIEIHKLEVAKDPARFNQLTGEQLPDVYEVNCAVCGWATDDPTSGCETLRLLALPCADRPGYREEWKP